MDIIKNNLITLRNFYQSHINSNVTSVLMVNPDISSPLFKPFYMSFINLIPFFIVKKILGIYDIDYLYETDGLIRINTETNKVNLLPIVLRFELVDEEDNFIIDLKEATKNYSNNLRLDYIIKNEYLKMKKEDYNFYLGMNLIYTMIHNERKLNEEEIKYYSNLGKVIKSSNFKIKINMIKNSIPLVKVISYDENKFCSKNEILSQL